MEQRIHLPLAGQLREHISFSELGLFNSCEWKWALRKLFSVETDERSLAMEFGSAIHSGMEFMFGNGEETRSPSDAGEFALSELAKNVSDLELKPHEVTELESLRKMTPKFFEDILSNPDLQGIRPIRSELQLYESIARSDGLDVKFKGFIDFIFVKKLKTKSVIYIADFKTCKWGWPFKKFQDITVIAQILLYKHFFCKLTGADPKNVTCAFILLKKTPPKGKPSIEVCKIGSGPKMIEAAIEYMQRTITAMHRGSYSKNFESCKVEYIDKESGETRGWSCPYLGNECLGSEDQQHTS